jgi:hypothetical protein
MDLFTHKENQTILWLTIQTTPLWKPFSESYSRQTNLWFRNIISHFYDKYNAFFTLLPMSPDDLRKINREVVLFMIADIKQMLGMNEHAAPPPPPAEKVDPTPTGPTTVQVQREYETLDSNWKSHPRLAEYDQAPATQTMALQSTTLRSPVEEMQSVYNVQRNKELREEKAKQEFETFQQKYQSGFERKQPPQIDFSETAGDSRIDSTSMEDLVKRHLAERERDMAGTSLAEVAPVSDSGAQYAAI